MEWRMYVITLHSRGYSVIQIRQRLQEENIIVCHQVIQSDSKIPELPHMLRTVKKSNQLLAFPLDLSNTCYDSNGTHVLPLSHIIRNFFTVPEHVLPTCLISASAILNRLLNT